MRTTIHLEERLFREVKRLAADTRRTFTDILHDALRELLARRRKARVAKPVALPTFAGLGPQPGVDLDNSAGLFDLMEGRG